MENNKKLHYKIFGLHNNSNQMVGLTILGNKLILLEKALKQTDQLVNGENGHDYRIQDLKCGSVEVVVEEIPQKPLLRPEKSGLENLSRYATMIGNENGRSFNYSEKKIFNTLGKLSSGVGHSYSHAEFGIFGEKSTNIKIDTYFLRKVNKTLADMDVKLPLFKGTVYETHIGRLKEVDLRKKVPQAKLILFIKSIEIQCYCESIPIETLRESLNKAVSVVAKATYDGINRTPTSLDLASIEILRKPRNLSEWKGKFDIPYPDREDIW